MRSVHYFAVQPDQPKCRLIEKISNFYNFVIFNQRSMKLGTHAYYELINRTVSNFFGPTNQKSVLYRFFKKKWDNFWMSWDIILILCVCLYNIHLLSSEKFFWNQMMRTSLLARNLKRWITSTKIAQFGWNLVCKLVLLLHITLRNVEEVGSLFCHPVWPTQMQTYRK